MLAGAGQSRERFRSFPKQFPGGYAAWKIRPRNGLNAHEAQRKEVSPAEDTTTDRETLTRFAVGRGRSCCQMGASDFGSVHLSHILNSCTKGLL